MNEPERLARFQREAEVLELVEGLTLAEVMKSEPDWGRIGRGGREPLGSTNGTEIFYRRDDDLMVVSISTTPVLELKAPAMLLDVSAFVPIQSGAGGRDYDASADGERFVFVERDESPQELHVVLNWLSWFEELERMAPTD